MDIMLIIGTATFAATAILYVWHLAKIRDAITDLDNSLADLEIRYGSVNGRLFQIELDLNRLTRTVDTLSPLADIMRTNQHIDALKADIVAYQDAIKDRKAAIKSLQEGK